MEHKHFSENVCPYAENDHKPHNYLFLITTNKIWYVITIYKTSFILEKTQKFIYQINHLLPWEMH